jgi:MerR family mercuric resistance operon transcriptional regulator
VDAKQDVNAVAKIGSVAKETGISIDTIRFYEKEGLVKRSGRSEGGYRLFSQRQIQDLKFIRKSQELGFSLNEIRELLVVRDESAPSCLHVRELLDRKLTIVREKIEALRILESSLKSALRKCSRESKSASSDHGCCPVLDELARASGRANED